MSANKYTKLLLCVLCATMSAVLCTGCSTGTTDEDTSDYCYISSLTIGTLRRTIVKRTGHNETSTTVSLIYTTGWNFTIDQVNNEIFNRDSLPTGCARRTLLDISYRGASLLYRPHNLAESIDWIAYSSTDSIDIPENGGVDFLVNGADGSSRVYNLKLNIHKQEEGDWTWQDMTGALDMSDWTEAKMANIGQSVILYGRTSSGWSMKRSTEGGEWEDVTVSGLPTTTELSRMVSDGDVLYVNDGEGKVWQSTDGAAWTEQGITDVWRPVGISAQRLYDIKDGKLRSTLLTNGAEWQEETLDDKPADMTDFNDMDSVRCLFYETDNNLKRILIVATAKNPTEDNAYVSEWCKMWSADEDEARREWNYYTPYWVNPLELPAMSPLAVVRSGNVLAAFGGTRVQKEGITPLDFIYISQDNGLTWKTDGLLYLPDELWGKNCTWMTATGDEDGFVWITARVNDTETYVVRGRQNSLGFAK